MLTLEQLYKLGKVQDIDIFENITLPENSPIIRQTLIDAIMIKCGMNYPMYADPFVMASAIAVWSAKNQYTFAHVGKILAAEYSPIENKDYYEDTSVERARERGMTDNTSGTSDKTERTEISTGNETKHTGTDTTTEEQTTSAYNSSTYQPDDKTVTDLVHGETIAVEGEGTTDKTTDICLLEMNGFLFIKSHIFFCLSVS